MLVWWFGRFGRPNHLQSILSNTVSPAMEHNKVPNELKGLGDVGAFLPSQYLPYEGQEFVNDICGSVISGRLVILSKDLSEEVNQKALGARRVLVILPVGREALEGANKDGSRGVV